MYCRLPRCPSVYVPRFGSSFHSIPTILRIAYIQIDRWRVFPVSLECVYYFHVYPQVGQNILVQEIQTHCNYSKKDEV